MNYELAKELKDAGFPQGIYDPTLSELIKACGEGFGWLNAIHSNGTTEYVVGNWKRTFTTSGDTPEEAVARLWLALNKKV